MCILDDCQSWLDSLEKIGKGLYPAAPPQHHEAFKNAAFYLTVNASVFNHFSSTFWGSSSRQELACFFGRRKSRGLTIERVIDICGQICYGPITLAHALMFEEYQKGHEWRETWETKRDIRDIRQLLSEYHLGRYQTTVGNFPFKTLLGVKAER